MFELNDKFYLGAVSGIIANIISNVFGWSLYLLDINKFTMWHISGSAFFPKKSFERITPLFIGAVGDYTMAALLGLFIVYLLYFTGLEHPFFKGLVATMFFWLTFYGMIVGTGITKINATTVGTNVTHFINHLILGIITPLIITRYGKQLLTPQ